LIREDREGVTVTKKRNLNSFEMSSSIRDHGMVSVDSSTVEAKKGGSL
jgi:hypothetical protein